MAVSPTCPGPTIYHGQRPHRKYGFSETGGDYYYQGGQVISGVWTDGASIVPLTPEGLGAQATAVASHMLNTMQWDPDGWQRQFHADT